MLPSNFEKKIKKQNSEFRIWILLKQMVPGILGLNRRKSAFGLFKGDKA